MMLTETKLPDLLLDLHDQYGAAFPRPQGLSIHFHLIQDHVSFKKAKADIEALLILHGILPSRLTITPGPEMPGKTNRRITVTVAKDALIP